MRYRYSRWDGTQDPFGPEVDASDVLEELADDVLMGTGADNALRRLMRRGMQGRFSGLDALRRRLNHMRQQEEEALDLSGPLEEVREQLDEILDRERSTLSFKAEDDARMREMFLDSLPPDAPGTIRELQDYRFVDPQAQQKFDQLMEHLREQVMGAYFRSMAEGMKNITPEQLAHFRDMLAELNQMIEQRARGDEYDFDGFMERYGDLFPDNPRSLDELLENMARRMAAMSRLMASLSPEQRSELQGLAEQVMQDMDLAFEMSRLGSNLQGAFPDMPWGEPAMAAGDGDEPMPLSATVDAMERMHDYEDLDRALRGDYPGATRRRRRRGGAPADPGRAGRPRPPPAQGGRARVGEGGSREPQERPPGDHAAGRAQARRARAGPGVRGAEARSRGNARGARRRRHGRADRRDPAVAVRRHGADRRAADRVQRGRPLEAG